VTVKNELMAMDLQLKRIEIDKAQGNALPKAAVEKAWSTAIITLRQIALQIPPKSEQMFPAWKDASEAGQAAETLIYDWLNQASQPIEIEAEEPNAEGQEE